MKLFKNTPIKQKVMLLILFTSTIVLMVAVGTLCFFQLFSFRQNFTRDLSVLAEVIANNTTPALAFKDRAAVEDILTGLKAKPHIISATIQLPDRSVFARYGQPESTESLAQMPAFGFQLVGNHMLQTKPMVLNHETIATLYLRANYNKVYTELLGLYAGTMAKVLAMSILLAVLLSSRLQNFVTGPIHALAETARVVAQKKDYSIRAEKLEGHELGFFTDSFNQMLSQIQSQDSQLQASEERFRSIFENTPIGLYRVTPEGKVVMANPTLLHMLGFQSLAELNERDGGGGAQSDLAQRAHLAVSSHGRADAYHAESTWRRKDGSEVIVRESSKAIRDAAGAVIYYEGTVEDITAQKQAEAELQRLNQQLIEASRQAGMAEVATGVLHNVGNVLNSINVSATLVRETLRKSEVSTLLRVADLVKPHLAGPGAFFDRDPKGKLVPGFIVQLADHLQQEHTTLQREHEQLARNVEHIKEIVSMQQNYARVSGYTETIAVAALVEDALQINNAALARHEIRVIRRFADVPEVTVDKHKVLQILINLVNNAKYAMEDSPQHDKELLVEICRAGDHSIQVKVQDNGVGIAPENLTRIFSHGFTTRKSGHGFGLHSGANAAKEMGGQLSVQSAGPGRGATFTLELPIINQPSAIDHA